MFLQVVLFCEPNIIILQFLSALIHLNRLHHQNLPNKIHQIHQSLLELTYVYFLPQHIQIKYDNENPSIQSCALKATLDEAVKGCYSQTL